MKFKTYISEKTSQYPDDFDGVAKLYGMDDKTNHGWKSSGFPESGYNGYMFELRIGYSTVELIIYKDDKQVASKEFNGPSAQKIKDVVGTIEGYI
jgi:hypothetical protein